MTLGTLQAQAKTHKWKVERLPEMRIATTEACITRSIQEKLIEVAVLANSHKLSLDRIAGFLERDMR